MIYFLAWVEIFFQALVLTATFVQFFIFLRFFISFSIFQTFHLFKMFERSKLQPKLLSDRNHFSIEINDLSTPHGYGLRRKLVT